MLYDLFICHASEDKNSIVASLAGALVREHLAVWYDDFELRLGDSLRRTIDRGLAESRFGVVVLSPAFFAKNWPQYELDGLLTREVRGDRKVLLPVWHDVTADDVARYSPSLAGRVAVSTGRGIDEVLDAILRVVRPEGSPLIIARDLLIGRGLTPPIVTEEYWLDVVEASNRVPGYGAGIPEVSTWGRWSFPLPELDGTPEARGERLAWTALQLRWTNDADGGGIDLCSEPAAVLEFIESHEGLPEMCEVYPELVAEFAPQLTIPGFGGPLEDIFENEYKKSVATAVKGRMPADERCAEEWLLRHPTFGGASDYGVAYAYVSAGMFGPEVRLHAHADYLFWLLSADSNWLPGRIHDTLLVGLSQMSNAWFWDNHDGGEGGWGYRGSLFEFLVQHDGPGKQDCEPVPAEVVADIHARAVLAISRLGLRASAEDLTSAFLERGVIGHAVQYERYLRRARGEDDE